MQPDPQLVLRDIHPSPVPSWWPLAPGWWVLAALVLMACVFALRLLWRRRQRRRALARLFDESVDRAATPAARIATMSDLLRRAARRRHRDADKLRGEAWLRFLDQDLKTPVFATGAGSILADGAFRRDVTPLQADALHPLARARFLQWMAA